MLAGTWFSRTAELVSPVAIGHGLRKQGLNPDLDRIAAQLQVLEAEYRLLRRYPRDAWDRPQYEPEPAVWLAREHVLRRRSQRHRVIVNSSDYDLADVILALLVGYVRYQSGDGHGIGGTRRMLLSEIDLILFDRTPEDRAAACERLLTAGFVEPCRRPPANGPEDDALEPTPVGDLAYDAVASRLALTASDNVYIAQPVEPFHVYYVWQSDYRESRYAIKDAIDDLVKEVNRGWQPVRPLVIEPETAPGDGAVRIDQRLLDRIQRARLVIADFTPIGEFCDVRCPNPNVLVEVGYALASKAPAEVILVECERPELDASLSFPFDIDKVRRIRVGTVDGSTRSETKDVLRTRLGDELEALLIRVGWTRADVVAKARKEETARRKAARRKSQKGSDRSER